MDGMNLMKVEPLFIRSRQVIHADIIWKLSYQVYPFSNNYALNNDNKVGHFNVFLNAGLKKPTKRC